MAPPTDPISAVQLTYARWLDWGTRCGLGVLIASFLAYALELVVPHVPLEELSKTWMLPVDEYRAAVGAPSGWGWLDLAARGDYLNYFGIVFLALVTAICYLRVLPMLFARGERIHALIALAEIVVLAAAAAGIVGAAH
jgi:hypothetical protein